MKLTKEEIIVKMAESEKDMTKAAARRMFDLALKTIVETVAEGGSVNLIGFGSFSAAETAARAGRNPATGESIEIPATKRVRFHAGTAFKKAVNAK